MLWKFIRLLLDQRGWTSEMAVTGVSDIDEVIPEYFAEGIIVDGNRESFWGGLSGKEGSRMPIIDKTGPLKQSGDRLTFSLLAQLMGAGRTGENVLKGYEEKPKVGTFTVTADIIRHATAVSRKSTKQANFDEVKRVRELLTDWMGRKLDADVFTSITGSGSVETLYAGDDNSSEADLNDTDGDTFGIAEMEMIRLALTRQGAPPLKVHKVNGRSIPVFGIAYGEIEDFNLNQNSTFVQAIRESFERFREGGKHPLFNGAVGMYRNMILYPYYSLLPIPQGTPLRPETIVYATLTTTATVLSVGGATNDDGVTEDYTAYFASSGSLQVENEILSYDSKTVNTFASLTRGVSSTTADQHVDNKLVTQRNVATVIGFGADAVCRAFPEKAEPIGENDDYKEQIGLGIRAYYGHKVRTDVRRAKVPSLVQMKVFSKNPGTV